MLKRILFYSTLILVVSCSFNAPLQISPILGKHTYAANEVPKHIEGYYYIENFKDTKDSIAKMLFIVKNKINVESEDHNSIIILEKDDDVYIDDGVPIVNESRKYYFAISLNEMGCFENLTISPKDKILFYEFKQKNKKAYNIVQKENLSVIKMAYKDITIETLQHFLNIVAYERRQTKDQLGQYTYQLQHKETQAIDCEIVYYNDPEKGLNNVFKIRFL